MTSMHQSEITTKELTDIKMPKKWEVIILNDDYTEWEFVVTTFMRIFNKTDEEANRLTKMVHELNSGVCGVYTKEIADSKVEEALQFARINKQPLKTISRQVD